MTITQNKCWIQQPVGGYWQDCFSIFGIKYQGWLVLVLGALVIGFGGYLLYSLVLGIKLEPKRIVVKGLPISLLVFVVLLVGLLLWWKWYSSQIIY